MSDNFGMHVDILRNKFGTKRDSKENEYSSLLYFLVYSESLSTQQGYNSLLLFNNNKIKRIGEI